MSRNALNPVQFRQKRLRHITWLKLKNLQIKASLFYVWFTIHSDEKSKAIYLSDKIQNDYNPNWKLKHLDKFSHKKFILRVWYSDRSISDSKPLLNLLLEADIDLDHFVYLGDINLNYSSNKFSNFIIFEFFDNFVFCEPIDDISLVKNKNSLRINSNEQKNSYDLNLLRRLCNFDRVIQEIRNKSVNFKSFTNPRIETLNQYTKLKMKVEETNYNIELYKLKLENIKESILDLNEINRRLNRSILLNKNFIENIRLRCRAENEKIVNEKKKCDNLIREQILVEKVVKHRQQELVSGLSEIFFINKNRQNSNQILNVCLDISKISEEKKDNDLNVALGFFVQALDLLSFILAAPLRYPIVFRSSKSSIVEFVENGNIREYALYLNTNGSEFNFKYALKLLESNVIQLRFYLDPKHDFKKIEDFLSHLKWMFDSFAI